MACPTCDHTMERIGTHDSESVGAWWCPRCGTMTYYGRSTAPKLVDRCRELLKGNNAASAFISWLRRLGILEAIYLPEDQPT